MVKFSRRRRAGFVGALVGLALGLPSLTCLGAPLAAVKAPQARHAFRLDHLRDPLTVTGVVQKRDGGSLVVLLGDAKGRKEGALFNGQVRSRTAGRLYVEDWLVPLGDPVANRVVRAIHRYADKQFTPAQQAAMEADTKYAGTKFGERGFDTARLLQAAERLTELSAAGQ